MSVQQMQMIFDHAHKGVVSEDCLMQKALGLQSTHVFTVPANVYTIFVIACGGGAAGMCADLDNRKAGQGGAAGFVERVSLSVRPYQRFEIYVGLGGRYYSPHEPLTGLQIEQKVFEQKEAEDTILFDCENNCIVLRARAGKGFTGGRALEKEQHAESGMASFQNGGNGFCDANGKWIGYGGGGGGGRCGGVGGCVYSNKKSSKPADAEENSGCGGGGCALVLAGNSKHFLPGAGAAGYVHIRYER